MELAYKLLSVEEFLDSCPNDQRHYQLIDGVIVAMAPPAIQVLLIARPCAGGGPIGAGLTAGGGAMGTTTTGTVTAAGTVMSRETDSGMATPAASQDGLSEAGNANGRAGAGTGAGCAAERFRGTHCLPSHRRVPSAESRETHAVPLQ